MKRIAAAILICAMTYAAHAQDTETPEKRLVVMLRGYAAECAIRNGLDRAELPRDPTAAQVDKALEKSKSCVADKRPLGKADYQGALSKAPESKAVLANVYARWMRYMDALAVYYRDDQQAQAEQSFDDAIAQVEAELDAR